MRNLCVIDDDAIFKMVLKKGLNLLELPDPMLEFNNGKEALEYFKLIHSENDLPEVIFLDINMHVMSGWDFLQSFQNIKSKLKKEVDIYLISNSFLEKDFVKAKSIFPVKDYLTKPIYPDTLKNILKLHQTV